MTATSVAAAFGNPVSLLSTSEMVPASSADSGLDHVRPVCLTSFGFAGKNFLWFLARSSATLFLYVSASLVASAGRRRRCRCAKSRVHGSSTVSKASLAFACQVQLQNDRKCIEVLFFSKPFHVELFERTCYSKAFLKHRRQSI